MNAPRLFPILCAGLVAAIATAATAQQAPADREDAALAYAQCMRENGYAEFPDPGPGGDIRFRITQESAPRFHAAGAACEHLAPAGVRNDGITPEALEALVKLSQCVRENGVPNFPDPNSEGTFDLTGVSSGPDDPRIEAAMEACRGEGNQNIRIVVGG